MSWELPPSTAKIHRPTELRSPSPRRPQVPGMRLPGLSPVPIQLSPVANIEGSPKDLEDLVVYHDVVPAAEESVMLTPKAPETPRDSVAAARAGRGLVGRRRANLRPSRTRTLEASPRLPSRDQERDRPHTQRHSDGAVGKSLLFENPNEKLVTLQRFSEGGGGKAHDLEPEYEEMSVNWNSASPRSGRRPRGLSFEYDSEETAGIQNSVSPRVGSKSQGSKERSRMSALLEPTSPANAAARSQRAAALDVVRRHYRQGIAKRASTVSVLPSRPSTEESRRYSKRAAQPLSASHPLAHLTPRADEQTLLEPAAEDPMGDSPAEKNKAARLTRFSTAAALKEALANDGAGDPSPTSAGRPRGKTTMFPSLPWLSSKGTRRKEDTGEALGADASSQKAVCGIPQDFDLCFKVASKHGFKVDVVRSRLKDFRQLDKNGDGTLTVDELKDFMSARCEMPQGEGPPEYLMKGLQKWLKDDETADFETFFLWSTQYAYSEEVVVTDPKDRYVRQLARDLDVCLLDVEKVAGAFKNADELSQGALNETQFMKMIRNLKLQHGSEVLNLRRCWMEISNAGLSHEVRLEDVLGWYFTVFTRTR